MKIIPVIKSVCGLSIPMSENVLRLKSFLPYDVYEAIVKKIVGISCGRKRHALAAKLIMQCDQSKNMVDFRMIQSTPSEVRAKAIEITRYFQTSCADMEPDNAASHKFVQLTLASFDIPTICLGKSIKLSVKKISKRGYWEKNLSKTIDRNKERLYLFLGLTGLRDGSVISENAAYKFNQQDNIEKKYSSKFNDEKKRLRRLLYVNNMVNGVARYARLEGYSCLSVTLTAPPEYHINGNFDGEWDPKNSPDVINHKISYDWKKISNKFILKKFRKFVFRVVEPHEDGTPHWHVLIWCQSDDVDEIISDIKNVFNTSTRSVDIQEAIDEDVDNFVRYLSKNLLPNKNIVDKVNYRYYSKMWGIRSYDFRCTPALLRTLWDKLQKVDDKYTDIKIIADLVSCVRNKDFYAFMIVFFMYENDIELIKNGKKFVGVRISIYELIFHHKV